MGLVKIVKDYFLGTDIAEEMEYQKAVIDNALENYPDINPKQITYLGRQRQTYGEQMTRNFEEKKELVNRLSEEQLQNLDDFVIEQVKLYETDPVTAIDKAVLVCSRGESIFRAVTNISLGRVLPTLATAACFGAYLFTKDTNILVYAAISEVWRTTGYVIDNKVIASEFREQTE